MSKSGKTVKTKVKPFPIKAKLTVGAESVEGQILKMTASGVLVEAPMPGLKTGTKFQIVFQIPMTNHEVSEICVLVKLYTSIGSHVIEGHFQALNRQNERAIQLFLGSIPKTPCGPEHQ